MRLICIFAVLYLFPGLFSAQEKHALIIAVSEYAEETGWSNLNSHNDVPLLTEALLNRGFKAQNVHSYIDEPISAQDILDLMNYHLIENTASGDMVFFHFSGHGQQIPDETGDEVDGLDEALVPYNAPLRNTYINDSGETVVYDYSRHLRDDDIGELLKRLRRHLGPDGNVFVSIDACHSGTATRGLGNARGTMEPNVPDDWTPPQFVANRGKATDYDGSFGLYTPEEEELATMVCFFGSQQNQLNYEYRDGGIFFGSLSYALAYSLSNATPDISYRALFDQIQLKMTQIAPNQIPVNEGQLDQIIFGGQLLPVAEYATAVSFVKEKKLTINKGSLNNYHEGSIVGFFPPDTRNIEEAAQWASGKIISSGYNTAVVELDQETDREQVRNAWIIITERSFGPMKASVYFDELPEPVFGSIIEQISTENPGFIEIVEDPQQADIIFEWEKDLIQLNHVHGLALGSFKQNEIRECIDRIREFAQAKYLRGLNAPNPQLRAGIQVLPLKPNPEAERQSNDPFTFIADPDRMDMNSLDGGMAVTIGDYVKLEVSNLSPIRIYYSLILMTPDYKINQNNLIFPLSGHEPHEYSLGPFEKRKHHQPFKIVPPIGTDILLLMVSESPIDLRSVFRSRGATQRGYSLDPLQELFANSFHPTRSTQSTTSKTENIGIYSIPLQITAK